ncbi:uncharacterized protein LOC135074755 isoform X1 [Ostrinia nubilalis]|uniref:uncharacterized protein LOC135074755 isoform X1 n=1 Tax=Ostrinia nubilalis TaxID=29057 RepID=UPI0030824D36
MASEAGVPVELYIYDLTNGMASLLSPAIIGRQIEGVWHTSIVVYEREFFYGGSGVTSCAPGGTQLGPPHQTERLGETFVPFQVFVDYIQGLATTSYTPSAYRLLEHNCNHFSEEVAQFLCGAHVPKHIVNQQEHLLSPPQRLAVQALLDNLVPHSTQVLTCPSTSSTSRSTCCRRRSASPCRRCSTTSCRTPRRYSRARAHRQPAGAPAVAAAAPRRAGAARQPRAALHAGTHVPEHIVNQQEHLLSPPQRLAVQALLDNLVPHSTQVLTCPSTSSTSRSTCCRRRSASPCRRCSTTSCRTPRRYSRARAHRQPAGAPAVAAAAPRRAGAARQPRAALHAGTHVPEHIVNQQEHLLSPPQRLAVQALLDNLVPHSTQSVYANGVRHSRQDSPEYLTLNNQIEEARVQSAELEQRRSTLAEKLARKERKKEKKRKKQHAAGDHDPDGADMAEAVEALPREEEVSRAGPSSAAVAAAAELLAEPRAKPRDPPIVFNDVDGPREYERLARALEGAALGAEERASLDELQQYLVLGEGSWVLGDEFLAFVGRLLNDETLSEEVRVATLSCLAACALRDDVSLLLHQDRRHHALLSYAHSIDARPLPEQRALARLVSAAAAAGPAPPRAAVLRALHRRAPAARAARARTPGECRCCSRTGATTRCCPTRTPSTRARCPSSARSHAW